MAQTKRTRGQQRNTGQQRSDGGYRLYDDMLSIASTLLRNRKEFGATKLQSLAEATRNFGGSVSDMPNLQSQIDVASQSIDDMANYIMHSEIADIIHDGSLFARRHPVATLAGTIAVGLGIGMILRPSNPLKSATASRTTSRAPSRKTKSTRKASKAAPREKRATNGSAHTNA